MSEVIEEEVRTKKARRIFEANCAFDSEEEAEKTRRDLLALGAIPAIDFYAPADCCVLWWMQDPIGSISVRPGLSEHFEAIDHVRRNESDVVQELVTRLENTGELVRTQVRCAAGVVDVLTESAVYEVEYLLSRSKLFEAVGQVLIYRAAIGEGRRTVIAGIETDDTKTLIPYINSLGIEVELL